jgi:two-component system osmolarity sensor histidine kinase EnvZ
VGRSNYVEVRIKLDPEQGHAGSRPAQPGLCLQLPHLPGLDGGLVLRAAGIAILFLRNQIRPILRLADAAESFGKGREVDFRPAAPARSARRAMPSSR